MSDLITELTDGELAFLKQLPAAEKLRALKAMGFTAFREPHTYDCPRNVSDGFRCNCVRPPTHWGAPEDVSMHMGETWEQRRAESLARDKDDG